jgi:hypothetical protein
MKLLHEFLIINEANERPPVLNIDGSSVELNEYEAERGYYAGRLLLGASHHGPAEYADDEDSHLTIESISFIVKSKGKEYLVNYDLKNKDYLDREHTFHKESFLSDLSKGQAVIYDEEDDEIKDTQTVMLLKSLVVKYAKQFDCLQHIYSRIDPVKVEPDNDYGDDNYDDDDEVSQFYDGN